MSDAGRNEHLYQEAVKNVRGRGSAADWYGLGCLLMGMGRGALGSAAGCFARCVELEPGVFRGWANLGWCLHLGGRSKEGAWALRKALDVEPGEGKPHALLSQIELLMGMGGIAIAEARDAVELGPNDPDAHLALAFALARSGEWGEAWREYEWRFMGRIPEFRTRPYRLWRGERVGHLYIEGEQGAGDAIFALRWVAEAAERADKVTLYIHQSLYSLANNACGLPSNVEVLPMPRPLPVADAWIPMMSLPAAVERGEPFFPGLSYVDPGICVGYDLRSDKPTRKVAIAWSGDPTHEQAEHRDCPLAEFLRLSEIPGVRLHSVQVGAGQNQFAELGCYGLIEDREPEITNFEDTARVLGGMDLVVCVDTAVGHLAGAMGVPCWLLVSRRGQDFRLGMEGEKTGWYPGHRLFRRGADEGWGAVLERVAAELRGLAG